MSYDWIVPLLLLLLPVAAVSGWMAAQASTRKAGRGGQKLLSPDYFKGLNYVLNEQPDKAIEIFVRMIEIDSETVETHLALGSLFRRRGEVDRAIRIHQNLIARPMLDGEYRAQALLELGLDYMKLGILDRAEGLFSELIAAGRLTLQAYTHLLDIYQQERDWDKAIVTARRLEAISARNQHPVMAQFYCELAAVDIGNGNNREALQNIRRALNLDPVCVRASLMEADIAAKSGDHGAAIKAWHRIEKQDPEYLPEVVIAIRSCYEALGQPEKYRSYVAGILENHGGITPLLCLTDAIAEAEGDEAAFHFISEELRRRPSVRGVDRLVKYAINRTDGGLHQDLSTIQELTTRLLENRPVYKCRTCGFEARKLHWRCPGCKSWNTVKPVKGVHGE